MAEKSKLHLSWIVPDGTNHRIEEIRDRKMSDGTPGGGSSGSVVVNLPRIEPYYGTQFFLVDVDTGEMFAFAQQQWRRTGLFCSNQPFAISQLMNKIERLGQIMQAELEAEQQTPVMLLGRTPGQFEVPPPLPMMDEPEVYIIQPDAMNMNMHKNYVRDHMRAALIYISEYAETQKMLSENKYRQEDLLVQLRAVFGRVDRIRNHIDQALQHDDAHRRRRDMRFLLLPTHFPRPELMSQGDVTVWTNWIREETSAVMNQLDEELEARGDPDDPFNGSGNGVYQPLPANFSLPPPVQMSRRQDVSEHQESSQNLQRRERKGRRVTNTSPTSQKVEPKIQMQAVRGESEEHSLESLDPMSSSNNRTSLRTQNLHQLQEERVNQGGVVAEREEGAPGQDNNLITFTPPPGQRSLQETTERQQQQKPKEQRTPKKKSRNNEWNLNQRQFDQNKPQELSHISPLDQANIYNTEESSMLYLQFPTRRDTDSRLCSKCGDIGHWRRYCWATTWCRFCMSETHSTQACRRYANFVRDNLIASSRRITPKQPQPPRIQSQQGVSMRQLFPQSPTQRFQAPVVPPVETRSIQYPIQRQSYLQRSSQDVRMDPCFRPPPPQYSQIQQHQRVQTPLVEVNELRPTIQQGVVQRPVRGTQPDKETRFENQTRTVPQNRRIDNGNLISGLEENGGDRLPTHNETSFPKG